MILFLLINTIMDCEARGSRLEARSLEALDEEEVCLDVDAHRKKNVQQPGQARRGLGIARLGH